MSDGDEGLRLIPYADTRWFEDRAAAFTDSIGTRIPGQTVSIGQLELGSNVEVPIAMSHGAMTFTGGLGLVYSKTEGDYIPSVSRSSGRGEIGFSYGLDDNVRIDFESFYDGIGTPGYEGYGLSLNAEIKFRKCGHRCIVSRILVESRDRRDIGVRKTLLKVFGRRWP